MPDIVDAIELFESALAVGCPHMAEPEQALHTLLGECIANDHDEVCEPFAEGCTEGVSHGGTIYAPGYGPTGEPRVIVIRRVRELKPSVNALAAQRVESGLTG